jgi:hypothetical protein
LLPDLVFWEDFGLEFSDKSLIFMATPAALPVAHDVNGLSRQTSDNRPIEQKGVFPGLSNGRGPPNEKEKGRTGDNLGRPHSHSTNPIAQSQIPGNNNFGDWRVYYDNASGNLDEPIKAVYRALGEGLIRDDEAVAIDATLRSQQAAASIIEALLYELRSGLLCLAGEGARNRLRSCDEAAMRAIAAELLSWKGKRKPRLPPWTEDEVAKLIVIWRGLK